MTRSTKLIILRGPSGSGKTTVSKRLFDTVVSKTCLIEQDYYRFIFKPAGGGSKHNSDTIHKMIEGNVLEALHDGYDVILEGILSVRSYAEVLERLFKQHPEEDYIFYVDISFEETVKRHATRKVPSGQFGPEDMQEWYPAAHRSGHKLEQIIPESFTLDETVEFIVEFIKDKTGI